MKLLKVIGLASLLAFSFSGVASASSIRHHHHDNQTGGQCGSPDDSCKSYTDHDKQYLYNYGNTSWTHNGLVTADSLTSADLYIKSYHGDSSDKVYAFSNDVNDWVSIGDLSKNVYDYRYGYFTEISLDSSWFDEIANGLQLKVIAAAVAHFCGQQTAYLKSSYLSVKGEYCPPVSQVPVPAALWLFAPALMGFTALRRRAKKA